MVDLLCKQMAISNAVFDADASNVVARKIEAWVALLERANGELSSHVNLIVAGNGPSVRMDVDCV